jgi:hypothetical protein
MVSNKTLSLGGVCAFLSAVIIALFWDTSFSSLNVNISMDRNEAVAQAVEQSKSFPLLSEHSKHAVMYGFDGTLRNYVELKAGGQSAFQSIIDEKIISPYYWAVRIFEENTIAEASFYYRPNGDPYGFNHRVPNDHIDDSLSEEAALALINERVNDYWKGDFQEYELIDSSLIKQSNDRVDHTFTYEHRKKDMGEARIRLVVKVSGTQVSKVEPFTFVPEAFIREFSNMRSSNTTITMIASFLMFGLYLLLIGIPALILLKRKGWLKYSKTSMVIAGTIACVAVLSTINFLPLQLFWYDTASSLSQFLLQKSIFWISMGLGVFVMCSITFVLAESLTRMAFPNHMRLWKTWSQDIASSKHVLNNTLFSYLMVPCLIAFVVLFYAITKKYFGFWAPAEAWVDPNFFATYCPWFTGFAVSLQAGFVEEMLFRAVPLSVGVLLGRHFNRPLLGLSIAMVVQIFIFGSVHASYPVMPAYARVVELIVPSLIFGFIYLRLGVIFGAIVHYLYDVAWVSIPVFASSGYLFDKSMVLFIAFIPLGVVLVQRYRSKQWNELKDEAFNRSFEPEVKAEPKPNTTGGEQSETADTKIQYRGNKKLWVIGILLSMTGLWIFQDNRIDIPLDSIELSRAEAITVAEAYLEENNIQLNEGYKGYATYNAHNHSDTFVWQELGEAAYNDLLGTYLLPPGWSIRFVNYKGSVESKNEEINLRMDLQGRVNYFSHRIPEERSGVSLSQEAAKTIVDRVIEERFGLDVATLKMVRATSKQQPNRLDWQFVYDEPHNYEYEGMQLRSEVIVAGDQITYAQQYIFIPETWQRMNRERWVIPSTLNQIINLVVRLSILMIFLIQGFKLLTTKAFSYRTFTIFASLGLLEIIYHLNDASLFAYFPTDQPIENLMIQKILSLVVMVLVNCLILGFTFAIMRSLLKETNQRISVTSSVLGGLFAAALFYLMTLPLEMLFPNIGVNYPEATSGRAYFPWINTMNIYPEGLFRISINLLIVKLIYSFTNGYENTVRANVIGFLMSALFVGFLHFPISFLIGISLFKVAFISLGTFLILKFIIRNNYLMVPTFMLGLYYINHCLARGGFFGFEFYPYESIISLASVLIAGSVILFSMRFVIDTDRQQ